MNATARDARSRWAPTSGGPAGFVGALCGTLALATAVTLAALSTQGAGLDAPALALCFAAPAFIVLRNGHFGWNRLRMPTPGGVTFVWWQIGLAPSMVAISDDVRRFAHASDDAILVSRAVFAGWFVVFAISLGRAKDEPPAALSVDDREPGAHSSVTIIQWLAVVAAFVASIAIAVKYDALSSYSATLVEGPSVGGLESGALGLYHILLAVVPPSSLLIYLRGSRWVKIVSATTLVGSIGVLFVFSQRRMWFMTFYLCLVVAERVLTRIPTRWLVTGAIFAILGGGPLTWSFRSQQYSTDSTFENAWKSVTGYATNPSARADAYEWGETNMRDRLANSGAFFAATDEMLRHGPRWTPTPLQGVVMWIPTAIWSSKNDVAATLSPQQQLLATGRFPMIDLGVSPITEFTYEFGPWLAPLGAIGYALFARWLSSFSRRGMADLPIFVVWASLTSNLSVFDGGTVQIVTAMRETLVLGLVLAVLGIFDGRSLSATQPRST